MIYNLIINELKCEYLIQFNLIIDIDKNLNNKVI